MHKALRILLPMFVALPFAGCAAWSSDTRMDQLEAQNQNQQVLDLRVSNVEDRLSRVENELGEMRNGKDAAKAGGKKVAAQPKANQAQAAIKPASAAASPQQTSVISTYPTPSPSSSLTLSKAKGTDPMQNPLGLGAEYSGPALAGAPASAPAPAAGDTPATPLSPSAGPGLEPMNKTPQNSARAESASARVPATGKSSYDAALALYYKGDYAKARDAFASFLRSSPGSALAPNAMYWEGECLYSLGKYSDAIMVFKDVVSRYPKHDKAAASLLKAGFSYERLKDKDNARFYWQILVDDFPRSSPATLARQRLATTG